MKPNSRFSHGIRRWIVFNLVGFTGVVVQLASMTWLLIWGLHYLIATTLAVEAAILNNFIWHERWTWEDRPAGGTNGRVVRFLRFNLTVGVVSIAQNLLLMTFLVEYFALHYLTGSLLAIAMCSLTNFLISDFLVFRAQRSA